MDAITNDQFAQAVAKLEKDDMTAKGEPKTAALNDALAEMDLPELSADDRSAMWADYQAALEEGFEEDPFPEDQAELDPLRMVNVTVTEAQTNPLVLSVHGLGRYELRLNEETPIPVAALEALSHVSNTSFDWEEVETNE